MKKIKFRGKSMLTGELVHGGYFFDGSINEHRITHYNTILNKMTVYTVYPETIGQFTGLTDKNEKEIYEGDIIEDKNGIGVIMWFQTAWGVASYAHGYDGLKSYTAVDSFYSRETQGWAVIGNIHENPQLLGKEAAE